MGTSSTRGILNYDKHHSIVTVLGLLYSEIKARSPAAATLLTFCAVMSPWLTPISLFSGVDMKNAAHTDDTSLILLETLRDDFNLRLAIAYLVEACLIKVRSGPDRQDDVITIHKAISQWALETQPETSKWSHLAADLLIAHLKSDARWVEIVRRESGNLTNVYYEGFRRNPRKRSTSLRFAIFPYSSGVKSSSEKGNT